MVTNRWLIGGTVAILLVVTLAIVATGHKSNEPSATNSTTTSTGVTPHTTSGTPTANELSDVIGGDDNPGMTYKVTGVTQPTTNWFIVRTDGTNEYGTFHQISVVERLSSGKLENVAGPDVSFPTDFLQSAGIPQAVINQLPTYTPTP